MFRLGFHRIWVALGDRIYIYNRWMNEFSERSLVVLYIKNLTIVYTFLHDMYN